MPLLSALDIVRLWNFGRRFFSSSRFSPQFRLDWDQHDAWGDLVALDWGVLNPTALRRFYHERSTTASVILCIGYDDAPLQGLLGPPPRPREDILFWNWWFLDAWVGNGDRLHRPLRFVRFLNRVLPPPPVYHFHRRAIFRFHQDLAQYPPEWTLEEIAHQHFLAYAVLNFWHIEVRGPPGWPILLCWLRRAGYTTPTDAMDALFDKMTLEFENWMRNWKRASKAEKNHHDERHKRELSEARDELLLFLLTMERVLLWLNRLGVWVAWSDNYNLQMMHLYPDAFDSFPVAERRSEFDKFRANLFSSRRPSSRRPSGEQSGITPLDAPIGPARLRLIPKEEDPRVQRDSATVFSSEGILSRLDHIVNSSGLLLREVEPEAPGYFFEGEELDVFLRESGFEPADFLNATLPMPPTPPPSPPPRDPTPPPIAVLEEDFVPLPPSTPPEEQSWFHQIPSRGRHSEKRKREPYATRSQEHSRRKTPTEPRADREGRADPLAFRNETPPDLRSISLRSPFTPRGQCSWPGFFAAFGEHDGATLAGFRFEFWEHRGEGSYQPLIPDPHVADLLKLSHVTSFRELLVGFRPLQSNSNAASRRRSKQRPKQNPIVISSDSEDNVPLGKRRKTASHSYVHVSSGEDENADSVPAVDDMGNYELEDKDVLMGDDEAPIADDPANYDPELEPAEPSVPPEQQASSSRTTLDDHPPGSSSSSHFLGFRLRPVDPPSSAATRDEYVEEIVERVLSSPEDPHRTEAQLLFMSTVFGRAGNELGRRRRDGDTKGKGHAQ
ncbi:hypothetical protein C8R45DRAFT_946106 [Mycena sanguinolenta]|nr:hypothetical protein C8R45DRAFT_946106 [Mycena sanguinolenta]